MQLVVDTNIVVAALLKKGDTRKLLFSKQVELFSPDRLLSEILKHKKSFMQKGSMTKQEFVMALGLEFENIIVVPVEEYFSFKQKAFSICPEGHKDDWPFFALAFKLGCGFWSQDFALKKQSAISVYSTSELLKKFT